MIGATSYVKAYMWSCLPRMCASVVLGCRRGGAKGEGESAGWLREYYSLQRPNLIAEYGRKTEVGAPDFRTVTICPRKRYRQRARAVICRLLNYRDELCKSRRRCYEISRHGRNGGGTAGRGWRTGSDGVNAFAEMPTFDPELFDPEEIRKARGCVLRAAGLIIAANYADLDVMKFHAARRSRTMDGGSPLSPLLVEQFSASESCE